MDHPGLSTFGTVAVTTTAKPFLAANPARKKIVFSSPRTARITLGLGDGLTDEKGIVLRPGTAPVPVCCCDYGDFPQREIWIIADQNETIGYVAVEVFSNGQTY